MFNEAERIREALAGRQCVSARLGHGAVLCVGMGDVELSTNFAAWSVEGPVSGAWTDSESDSELPQLRAAAESLVGEHVLGWELLDRLALRVAFSGNKVLTVQPWPVADGISDAWCLHCADKHILAVSTDGRMVVVHEDLPIRDWFAS